MTRDTCVNTISHVNANECPYMNQGFLSTSTRQVAAADHGFVDGAQHSRQHNFRESPYDTCDCYVIM